MSRLKTLERRNIGMGVLIVGLLAVIILRPSRGDAVDTGNLRKVFPKFEAANARVIEIRRPGQDGDAGAGAELVLGMAADGQWVARSQAGFPLLPGRVDRLLESIRQMRRRKLVTTRSETFAQYAGAGWLSVRVLDKADKELVAFSIGKPANYPEHFALVGAGEQARVIQMVKVTPDMAEPDLTAWAEPRLFPGLLGEQVQRIDVEQPAFDRTISLGLKGALKRDISIVVPKKDEGRKDQTWWLSKPKIMDADSDRARDLVRSFTGVRFSRVVAANVSEQDRVRFGLVTPDAIVRVWHRSALGKVTHHLLLIGGKSEDGSMQYVQAGAGAWVYEVAPYQLSDARRLPEDFEAPPLAPKDDEGANAGGSPDGVAGGSPDGDGAPAPAPVPAPAPGPEKKPDDKDKPGG